MDRSSPAGSSRTGSRSPHKESHETLFDDMNEGKRVSEFLPLEDFSVETVDITCSGWDYESSPFEERYVVYVFELSMSGVQWVVRKRFSQFVELNELLSNAFPMVELPLLPEKKWFGNQQPEVLRERSFQLQLYLQKLLSMKPISGTIALSLFLNINRHKHREHRPKVLIPLPNKDFDTTEVSVPWKLMVNYGFEVVFATETGVRAATDELLIRPEGVIFGQMGAEPEARAYYHEMEQEPSFLAPTTWEAINAEDYDGLLLPGGHAPGMKQYLESTLLQDKISEFWRLNRPVAAICHGVLLLGRCKEAETGRSLLFKKRTTSLPKYMENLAYSLTMFKHGRLYRTYDLHCEDEIRLFLEDHERQFIVGPTTVGSKGTLYDDSAAFVVEDGNYISARWPGDAYLFGRRFIRMVESDVKERRTAGKAHHHRHHQSSGTADSIDDDERERLVREAEVRAGLGIGIEP